MKKVFYCCLALFALIISWLWIQVDRNQKADTN